MKINIYRKPVTNDFIPNRLYQCILKNELSLVVLCIQGKQTDGEFPGVIVRIGENRDSSQLAETSHTFVKEYFVLLPSTEQIILANPIEIKEMIKFEVGNYYEMVDLQVVKCSAISGDILHFQTIDGHPVFDIDFDGAYKIMRPFVGRIEFIIEPENEE